MHETWRVSYKWNGSSPASNQRCEFVIVPFCMQDTSICCVSGVSVTIFSSWIQDRQLLSWSVLVRISRSWSVVRIQWNNIVLDSLEQHHFTVTLRYFTMRSREGERDICAETCIGLSNWLPFYFSALEKIYSQKNWQLSACLTETLVWMHVFCLRVYYFYKTNCVIFIIYSGKKSARYAQNVCLWLRQRGYGMKMKKAYRRFVV